LTRASLLLADPSPNLRRLTLLELLKRPPDDSEVEELESMREEDPIVASLLALQSNNGSWREGDLGGSAPAGKLQATSQALTKLGYLGFSKSHPAVKRAAEYMFAKQLPNGAWPLQRGVNKDEGTSLYSTMPLQTAMPLRGLAACGYSTDPRAERSYDWLMEQRLEDGAWPTGKAGEVYGYVAGYRRLPHSRWGCRSNTTASLICLANHPTRRESRETRRALDLLMGRETREKQNVGFDVARIVGAEQHTGYLTYYAKFDLALILDLCWRIGANRRDERVADLISFIQTLQGPYGLWQYNPRPECSRWITFDILRSLFRLDDSTGWLSVEPRTPFKAYPKKPKRF